MEFNPADMSSSADWDRRYAAPEPLWRTGPNQFVESELGGLPPGHALDVAAGEGRNALWLAERGWDVTAVDFSRVALDKGRVLQSRHERGADLAIRWVLADALTHDLGTQAFDLTLVAYLHLPADQRRSVIRRSFRSLRPDGTFFLIAHDSTNLAEGTGGPQDAEVLFTAEDVLADLDGERFDVIRAERVPRSVPAPQDAPEQEARIAYDALVRLVRTDHP